MAVSVHANMKTAAVERSGQPIRRVWFDWDDAGFAAWPTGWYDESDHVISLNGAHEAVGWRQSLSAVGHAAVDRCNVLMHNPLSEENRRFGVTDPNAVLYSKMSGGNLNLKRAIVETGYHYAGTDYYCRQITGYVVGYRETDNAGRVEFEIRDRGAELAEMRAETALFVDAWPKTYIEALLGCMVRDKMAADGGYGESYIDPGFVPVGWLWADNNQVWNELSDIAEASMGRVFFDREGNFHFQDAGHWVRKNTGDALQDPFTVQAALTRADYKACVPDYDIRRQFDRVEVEYTPRYRAAFQDVYSSPDVWMVAPGETEEFEAQLRHPVYGLETPTVNEDYTVVTPGGTDISGDVSISFTTYATTVKIEVTNNNTNYAALITGMSFRGWPIFPRQAARYKANASGTSSERVWHIVNPFIQTRRHAQAVAEFAIARFENHVHGIHLVDVPGRPWLEVGDRIQVEADGLDPGDKDYFITNIRWELRPPATYMMDIDAIRVSDLFPYSDYFNMGGGDYRSSTYGTTGSYDGRLFW